jgi:cytochrome c biogenesis protein CcmG/thiol:disulfide interchange protein DsbE
MGPHPAPVPTSVDRSPVPATEERSQSTREGTPRISRAARRLLVGVLSVALLALALAIGLSGKSSPAGRLAPALPKELLAGSPTTLATLRATAGGRPSLVVFWASWCEPCQHEAPAVERFALSPAGRGRVVGVDWSDETASAHSFIGKYHWSFSNLRDGEGAVGYSYGLTGLPTTFVVGADGRIERTLRGPQTEQTLGRALEDVG